ncbi:YybH family protein [Aquabacterium sp.]|uniref:YybH family protein n=1 Tax=Aquabacterium sp. TaxID=1872578 RepID=UPI003783ABB6
MRRLAAGLGLAMTLGAAAAQGAPDLELLRKQVTETEKAFARSMAERDFAAFARHLSEGTVFYGRSVLRGKAAVMAAWKPFYEGDKAPFSWEPDQVDVLPDGTLAHSSGPVRDENGKRVSRFNSVWRQESPGVWRIVFDKGQPLSEAEKQLP